MNVVERRVVAKRRDPATWHGKRSFICLALALVCIAASADSAVEGESRFPDSHQVFACKFDDSTDPNADGWPRGWTRRKGPSYPHYVKIGITPEPGPDGSPALEVNLNGGAAAVFSPEIAVEMDASYVLELQVQSQGLKHDRVRCTVTWLDGSGTPLGEPHEVEAPRSDGWHQLRLGPISVTEGKTRFARIGLHVTPHGGQDLHGRVRFDDLWFGRLPRVEVYSSRPQNLFTDLRHVEVGCRLSGLSESISLVKFELFDIRRKSLASATYNLHRSAPEGESGEGLAEVAARRAGERTIVWKPPITELGFYRLAVTLGSTGDPVHRRDLTLVVLEPQRAAIAGEFGWNLPALEQPFAPAALAQLVSHAGVNWVKLPCWVEFDRLDELSWFIDRLRSAGVETVALLDHPPSNSLSALQLSAESQAAETFAAAPEVQSPGESASEVPSPDEAEIESHNWYPWLEPVLVQLSLRVRWWQLGGDDDLSFFGYPHLDSKIAQIKTALDQIGQDSLVGLPWNWIYTPPPSQSAPPWKFLSMSAEPPLTADELGRYLDASRELGTQCWALLPTLPASRYSIEERTSDLAQRMVAAKVHGAQRVFLPQPFDREQGVMEPDGSPGELFLPWRTMALALASATHLGSLNLPGGSRNEVFLHDDRAVMVVWNDQPTTERVYLGENVVETSLWGQQRDVSRDSGEQVIEVGRVPKLLTNLNVPIIRLQLGLKLDKQSLDNIPDLPQRATLTVASYFQQGASGKVSLSTPDAWRIRPRVFDISLAANETATRGLDIALGFDAETGRKPLSIEFDLVADQRYQFRVVRWLDVGLGDVRIELDTRMNSYGDLEVEQRLFNDSGAAISYNCDLFAPDRRRQRMQILRQPPGESVRVFRYRDGHELLGQTLRLRAEELGGRHVLNYKVVARPATPGILQADSPNEEHNLSPSNEAAAPPSKTAADESPPAGSPDRVSSPSAKAL